MYVKSLHVYKIKKDVSYKELQSLLIWLRLISIPLYLVIQTKDSASKKLKLKDGALVLAINYPWQYKNSDFD